MNHADPFVFLCLRFALTCVVLLPIILLTAAPNPRNLWHHRHDMVTGLFLHFGYLGFVFWPIQLGVPAGIVAIIVGIQPVLTSALASVVIGESLTLRKMIGLLTGFIGITVVITGKYGIDLGLQGGLSAIELAMCIASLCSIAIGLVYQKRFCSESSLLSGTLMQYFSASIACGLFAFLIGESWMINWANDFMLALVWQVLGLSIGAVVLLMLIINHGEASKVSSMFYLVPPLAALEAHWLFEETLGWISITGMVLCGVGVYVVNRQTVSKRA